MRRLLPRFKIQGFFAGAAEDKMDFHIRPAQFFEEAEGIDGSTRARDADNYSQIAS